MEQFIIHPNDWYAWQMLPGYGTEGCVPYCSPIRMHSVQPLKTGRGVVQLSFLNALYAEGVQSFTVDLRVFKRAKNYLVGEILCGSGGTHDRCAVISDIEFEWIRRFCPGMWQRSPPSSCDGDACHSVSAYLDELLFRRH